MAVQLISKHSWVPEPVNFAIRKYNPKSEFGKIVKKCMEYLPAYMAVELLDNISRIVVFESQLRAVAHVFNPVTGKFEDWDFGVVSNRLVTDNGVAFLVDAWQNIVELESEKYHGLGTGTTAEAQTDTALVTELTTEYTGNVRATGTTVEGATANVFRTVATNTLDSGTPAVTEHGIFDQAATGGGVLWDRSVFAAINLVGANGDGLTTTYDLTATAGG